MQAVVTFPFVVSAIGATLTGLFAAQVLWRGLQTRRPHLLAWGFGLLLFFAGLAMQVVLAFGWNASAYRLWYWSGAIAVAPWLGQGTIFLLVRRGSIARNICAALILVSLMTFIWMFITPLTPPVPWPLGADLVPLTNTIMPPFSGSVRAFVPITNAWGTLALVGGAVWSARLFATRQIMLNRVWGNVLIALGGLLPAIGGYLIRLDLAWLKNPNDVLGAVLIFLGYLLATRAPKTEPLPAPAAPTPTPAPTGD